MGERQFDESEIGPILQRAAELQAGVGSAGTSGLTLAELQRVASEVGIDPAMVERAARESASQPLDPIIDERATSILIDRTIDGALDEEAWEDIVAGFRLYARRSGSTRQRGSTMEWTCRSDTSGVTFSASRRGNQTRLRLMGEFSRGAQAAWAVSPPIFCVFGIMAGALLFKHGADGVLAFGVSAAIMATAASATYFGVRAWTHRARQELRAIFERATKLSQPLVEGASASLTDNGEEGVIQRLG